MLIPIVPRAEFGWALILPLLIAGSGLGMLVSQLNNYTLAPISDERVSEAAAVNSAAGSFGLSFGLAFAGAIMLATLATTFTSLADVQCRVVTGRATARRAGARGGRGANEQHAAHPVAGRPTTAGP